MLVLLVDDDKFFQHFYQTKLKESGFEVNIAGDGEEGLAQLLARKPDIILLDLIMPKMNGFDFLNKVSKDSNYTNIPILVFSSLGQEQDVKKALTLGAKGYINKTFFDFDNLLRKIFELTTQ